MWIMCLRVSYEKKTIKIFFFLAFLKSLKKVVKSGYISQRYGSADPVSDPHQNVTDPQHCLKDC
jgi:hypothetical protein